jgi:hypothetical protein
MPRPLDAFVYDIDSVKIIASYKTEAAAERALNNATNKGWKLGGRTYNAKRLETFATISSEQFHKTVDYDVEVINIMSNKPVTLKKSAVGGPCDPSTERYWSM